MIELDLTVSLEVELLNQSLITILQISVLMNWAIPVATGSSNNTSPSCVCNDVDWPLGAANTHWVWTRTEEQQLVDLITGSEDSRSYNKAKLKKKRQPATSSGKVRLNSRWNVHSHIVWNVSVFCISSSMYRMSYVIYFTQNMIIRRKLLSHNTITLFS